MPKKQRVKLIFLQRQGINPIEFESVKECIAWLKDHNWQTFSQQLFSDYFSRHPGHITYIPDHRLYAVEKIK